MSINKAFDKEINSYLIETPNSSHSETIRILKSNFPNYSNYYDMFDFLSYRIGVSMSIKCITDITGKKTIGYIPIIKYLTNNYFQEKPNSEYDTSIHTPIELTECYKYLAKGILYHFSRIPNLIEVLKKDN